MRHPALVQQLFQLFLFQRYANHHASFSSLNFPPKYL
jgi:hypothetical protein